MKHHNAFDNSAIEVCQICRRAAHLRVEARSYEKDGQMKGSDHANMLTAFSIGKKAGLIITNLKGEPLGDVAIELDKVQDFICSSSLELLQETLSLLHKNCQILGKEFKNRP